MNLKSKVLKSIQGVAYGHMTLKAMQNWKLSKVDLLVREVIQNSSDAADRVTETEYFAVAFNTHEFNGRDFIDMLDGFDDKTRERFSGRRKFLEIRDSGTKGLTGELTVSERNEKDHGDYYRLVFDTGKPQTQKNSGGNWGYGKGAYYGLGVGFVIYYSQIQKNDKYESRLIVTLIEDEESETAILKGHVNGSNSAGKAWWGGSLDGEGIEANILPLQDEEEIEMFLSIFDLKPFEKGQTGTSVIIPYIDYKELMSNMISDEMDVSDDVRNRCSWTFADEDGFKDYLKLAIQKWYAPAINNMDLPILVGKKWLYASVNDEPISYESMYPFFQLTQRLYTAALAKTLGKTEERTKWSSFYENTVNPISIRNYIDNSGDGNTVVGYLAIAKLPVSQVNVGEEANIDPYLLLGYYEENGSNRPVVMYARRLGMVIDYAYKDEWVDRVPAPEDDSDYIFSFFVPCLGENKKLKSSLSVKEYAGKTLEEYLISCEASDHEGWEDHDRITIVSSIQKHVADGIKNIIKGAVFPPSGTVSDRLGNAFSRMIGISKGKLGKVPSGGGNGTGGSSISKKVKLSSEIIEFKGTSQELHFRLECQKGLKKISINPILFSDGSNLRSIEWEKDIRSTFPVDITGGRIYEIIDGEQVRTSTLGCTVDNPIMECEGLTISIGHERKISNLGEETVSSQIVQVNIEFDEPIEKKMILDGIITVHTRGTEYEYDLVASEEMR